METYQADKVSSIDTNIVKFYEQYLFTLNKCGYQSILGTPCPIQSMRQPGHRVRRTFGEKGEPSVRMI